MQTINIDISESGRILIEDRVYYPADNGIDGMVHNTNTNEAALLKVYDDQEILDGIEAFAYNVLAAEEDKRGFRNIIYPRVVKQNSNQDEGANYFVFTELPFAFTADAVYPLEKALAINGFSIYSRIMATLNLAESFTMMQSYVGRNILSIHPEDIYVNIENGEVYILIEQWLRKVTALSSVDDFGFSPEWYSKEEKEFTEADFSFFMAYAIFRLLLNDDPFDGSETLLHFPLLTKEAMRAMRADNYTFVLAKGSNYVSEYIGQGLWRKWRMLPAFIRNEFEMCFTTGMELPESRTKVSEWLEIMRKIRDCLVNVNGQVKFCDPDVSNKVLFMAIDGYKIPVWPQKAIYWYHVNVPFDESKNGIVAGVTAKDGRYYLNNLSGNVWGVTLNNTTLWIQPEQETELIEGMTVQIGNDKIIKIINGLVDDPLKTVDVAVQDLKDPVINSTTTDVCDSNVQVGDNRTSDDGVDDPAEKEE